MTASFYSFQTLPVNYAGVLLIVAGIILFILELKITSYGMLSVSGLVSLTLGSLMLFKTTEDYMRVSLNVLIPVVVTVGGFFLIVTALVVRAHAKVSPAGPGGLVGLKGPVKEWQQGRGKVMVHGEWWNAAGEEDLRPGEEIEVTAVNGMRLEVRRIRPAEDSADNPEPSNGLNQPPEI
ncbi:MAG: NfeD family protein [Thermodesulfobacteriota bacterium]|nr:NfeD family protein [Thermodesulfobacteriota bacterium]